MLVAALLSLLLGAVTPSPQFVHAAPPWLDYMNSLRATAGLPPVTENVAWSAGDLAHSQYTVVNNVISHSETPGVLGYSLEGNAAAANGNVAASAGSPTYTYQNAIDGWMTGPFHALGIIDPTLAQTGFGIYTDFDRQFPNLNGAATLDVGRGQNALPAYPVFFPGNGKQMPYRSFNGDSPDPLTACGGYTAPTGPPLLLLFATVPTSTNVSLTRDGTPGALATCAFSESTYTNADVAQQDLGRGVLAGRHAIVVMPQAVFTDGTYRLTVNNGGTITTIIFGVGAVPHILQTITVTPTNRSVLTGNTLQFTATGNYSDNSTQNLTGSVTWGSTDLRKATIAAGGLVTRVAPGTTTITATSGGIVGQTTLIIAIPVNPQPPLRPTAGPGGVPSLVPVLRPTGPSMNGVGTPNTQPARHP